MIDEHSRLIINRVENRSDKEFMCFIITTSVMAGALTFSLIYSLLK